MYFRTSVQRQLQNILVTTWFFMVATMTTSIYIVFDGLSESSIKMIVFISCMVGGFMMQMVDVWKYYEQQVNKNKEGLQ